MAGVLRSTKDLWVLISGTSQLCSKELVGTELEENSARLLSGIGFYKKPTSLSKEIFQKRSTKDATATFIEILSKLLNVEESQCNSIFCSYLLYEYKGTQSTLQNMLKSERHMQPLLHEVWNYYYSERSYSLMCLKQVLSHWQDNTHPYQELYEGFLESISENEAIVIKVIDQLEEVSSSVTPSRETHGIYMTDGLIHRWVIYNLKEQLELLQILLLYYNVMEPNLEDVYKLLTIFQKHSFGQRLPFRQHLNESHQTLVSSLGFLESILMIECMEVEWIHKLKEDEIDGTHYLMKDMHVLKRLDSLISSLGYHKQHGPILLGWMLVQTWTASHGVGSPLSSARLGRAAISQNVFQYLTNGLQLPGISGSGVVPNLVHGVVYVLLYVLLSAYEVETLGNVQMVHAVARQVMKYQNIANDFWEKDRDKGLGVLLRDAMEMFPLHFSPFLKLCEALCQAGPSSCKKVYHLLQKLPIFTEILNQNLQNVISLHDQWQLAQDHAPYSSGRFIIPKGTLGYMMQKTDEKGNAVIQWHRSTNGWQVCLCELHAQLQLLSFGIGNVTEEMISRVEVISNLTFYTLKLYPSRADDLEDLLDTFFTVLERFSIMSSPPTKLLAGCVDVFCALSRLKPTSTWQRLGRDNFFPFFTGTMQSVQRLVSGLEVNMGIVGQQLAAQERVSGNYDLCMAFLRLIDTLAEHAKDDDSNFLACLVFILQEIFPNYRKWRYVNMGDRERLGQSCLRIFHKLLKVSEVDEDQKKSSKLQEVCAYSLLNTAAGQSLLRCVATGEPVIRQAMEREASQSDGLGQELMTLVRLSLSVLNRLLLLKPLSGTDSSALQSVLFSLPTQPNQPHLMLLVAYYTFQRYDPRLAALAVQLLRRCAQEFPMSLLACFGTEATAIRDLFLLRLRSATEDVRLKVSILRFLTACVVHQPGIIEMFTNIKDDDSLGSTDRDQDCLRCVMDILKERNKSSQYCPQELHLAAVEFVHALWAVWQMLAVDHMKKDPNFWSQFGQPLLESKELDNRVMAYIIHTLTLEVFHSSIFSKGKLDAGVKDIFMKVSQKCLLSRWSKEVHSVLPGAVDLDLSNTLLDTSLLPDDTRNSILLLTAWRQFLLIVAKEKPFLVTVKEKEIVCGDILTSLTSLISLGGNRRILILLSELYMLLLREWEGDVASVWDDWIESFGNFLCVLTENIENVHPRFHLAVITTLLLGLNVAVVTKHSNKELLTGWIPSVCLFVMYSARLAKSEIGENNPVSHQFCMMTVCLLKELVFNMSHPSTWLSHLEVHSIIARLTDLLVACLRLQKALDLAHCIMTFFFQLSSIAEASNNLHAVGLVPAITLLLAGTYSNPLENKQVNHKSTKWVDIYILSMQLVSQMLHVLRHFFLQDGLNFVGAHVERMNESLCLVRHSPHTSDIRETIATCTFIFELSAFQQIWRLEHPVSLNVLLSRMCEACNAAVAYLIKPSLLEHLIEQQKGGHTPLKVSSKDQEMGGSLHSLSCSEDFEKASPALSQTQNRLLEIVAISLSTLQLYSPSLCDVLSDQNVDAGQWEMLLHASFSTPSVEKASPLSLGTILTCINLSLRAFAKSEKAVSPSRLPVPEAPLPTEKNFMMYVLEKSLALLLAQAALYQYHPDFSLRDKQFARRELAAELNSLVVTLNRYLRRGVPLSPAGSSSSLISPGQVNAPDRPFIRLVSQLVEKLFK